MNTVRVTTQAELDAALARIDLTRMDDIRIESPHGVWIEVTATGTATVTATGTATVTATDTATVRAYGQATVRAYGQATVIAYGKATVEAYGTATVIAYDTATVEAYGTATVEAYGTATVRAYGTATVRAYEKATVEAYGQATVTAYGQATVTATGTATVRAYDTATVRAYEKATVEAYGQATVRAYDTATVEASKYVAVHVYSTHVKVDGGVVINLAGLDLDDPQTWVDYTGAETIDGDVVLYKAVDENLAAGHDYRRTHYPIGEDVTALDWRDDNDCGGGLHASPHPRQARRYYGAAKRMLRVTATLDSLRPIGTDKAKAPTYRVLDEVALNGSPLTAPSLPKGTNR